MLITTKGTTIERKNGLSLIEYSAGDHEESYYNIINTKTREQLDYTYLVPSKGHRQARKWFAEYIREVTAE